MKRDCLQVITDKMLTIMFSCRARMRQKMALNLWIQVVLVIQAVQEVLEVPRMALIQRLKMAIKLRHPEKEATTVLRLLRSSCRMA